MSELKLINKCSINVTPEVINMVTGLKRETINIKEKDMCMSMLEDIIVKIYYTKGLEGVCYLTLTNESAIKITLAMMGMPFDSPADTLALSEDIFCSATQELLNQIAGRILCEASNINNEYGKCDISCPNIITKGEVEISSNITHIIEFSNEEYDICIRILNCLKE